MNSFLRIIKNFIILNIYILVMYYGYYLMLDTFLMKGTALQVRQTFPFNYTLVDFIKRNITLVRHFLHYWPYYIIMFSNLFFLFITKYDEKFYTDMLFLNFSIILILSFTRYNVHATSPYFYAFFMSGRGIISFTAAIILTDRLFILKKYEKLPIIIGYFLYCFLLAVIFITLIDPLFVLNFVVNIYINYIIPVYNIYFEIVWWKVINRCYVACLLLLIFLIDHHHEKIDRRRHRIVISLVVIYIIIKSSFF